jgi:hypothetical protein
MGLSFDQYRYFSAALVRELSQRVKAKQAVEAEAAPRASTGTTIRPSNITWLVPRPRLVRSTKPD